MNSIEVESLVGKAIQKKFLAMEDASGSKSLSQMGKKSEGYTLKKGKDGGIEKSVLKQDAVSHAQTNSDQQLTKA